MRQDANGAFQVWVANPDLTRQLQITNEASGAGFAVWSPDGTRLAMHSGRSDPDPSDGVEVADVFTMRPDGSDIRKVTDSVGFNGTPAWSPDGRVIAFTSDRADYPAGQGIYVTASDASGPIRRVTPKPDGTFWAESPRFSPDGTTLVFTALRGARLLEHHREGIIAGEQSALFTVHVDGSALRQITPWGAHTGDADWSPAGRQIVFETVFEHLGNGPSVAVVNADGTHLKVLTHDHGLTGIGNDLSFQFEASFDPVWSPDGTKILFPHDSYTGGGGSTGLMTISPDGTGQTYVSTIRDSEHQPDWGTAPLVP